MSLSKSDLLPQFSTQVFKQDYSAKTSIEGVHFTALKRFLDDGGTFSELARIDNGQLQGGNHFSVRQFNYSTMMPGTIKAFHMHFTQTEYWFVPPESRLLVGLIDTRANSKTAGATMRFVMGDGNARLLYIPNGVAHGAANLGTAMAQIIYIVDQQFSPDPTLTDEHRLPWNAAGDHFWTMERG